MTPSFPTLTPRRFRQQLHRALHDPLLQAALTRIPDGFIAKRARALSQIPNWAELTAAAARRKDQILAQLDEHLLHFERAVRSAGGHLHWAQDAQQALQIILAILRQNAARLILKSKSMLAEEIGLNQILDRAGYRRLETDLGEYIIQLAQEPPSHLIAPAIHKTSEQIAELFARAHGTAPPPDPLALAAEVRAQLRPYYAQADVAITGANFLIAETGQALLVTNEGNADLAHTLARTHIVLASVEKILPTPEDSALYLRLLAPSATGQPTTVYTTYLVGPRRPGDPDGPHHYHVILLDNGRTQLLGTPFQPLLRCIRCGACLNHCPIYAAIGGHPYGWVYPGPIGALLTPLLLGPDAAPDLPHACTLNGHCAEVCPVQIPLPDLIRHLRHLHHRHRLTPSRKRHLLTLSRNLLLRPSLYHLLERLLARLLPHLARKRWARSLSPLAPWLEARDLPNPPGRTFLELWQRHPPSSSRAEKLP
ncbi:MAG: lactate utilization protein [Hydrogenophilus sp.]|nr:lactate utilization protein [Hydrogenophilus sp.]